MAKNYQASRRGFIHDPITNTLDLNVDGVIATKFGGERVEIYNADSTQLYPLGTRLQVDDRVFRYALAGTNGVNAGFGAFYKCALAVSYEAAGAASVAGDTTMTITESSITANEWKGGYVVMGHGSSATTQNRRIISNTASSGTTCTITLDGPIHVAGTHSVEIIPSIYKNLQTVSTEFDGCAGVPAITTTTGKYFWVQTWGPCWIVPGGAGTPGSTSKERAVYFVGDGSINGAVGLVSEATEAHYRQYAGYIIQTDSAGSGGPPFIMLQVSP
uniref:Tail protein n=1 Tax=viral metagenome TaxID=1070528 RepID=A0A6M3LMU0_9ZZZZ